MSRAFSSAAQAALAFSRDGGPPSVLSSKSIAMPHKAMALHDSCLRPPSKTQRATRNQYEWSIATPRSNSACTFGSQEVGKLSVPSLSSCCWAKAPEASAAVIRAAARSVRGACLFIACSFGWPCRASVAATLRRRSPSASGTTLERVWHCFAPHPSVQSGTRVRGLVGITLKPWRVGLPVMPVGEIIADRHLDLRQTLSVEYLVLRDHLIEEEQVGGQRIDLVGGESPLLPDRHAAIDEIPHDRRIRGAQRQDALPIPDGKLCGFFRSQDGRHSLYASCAMAGRAPLVEVDLRALLGVAAARREFVSLRADRDIHAAEFVRGRRASHAIGGRLRERMASQKTPQQQRDRDNLKRTHWSRSRPWRSSRA